VAEELRRLLAEDCTWTGRQFAERGVLMGPRLVRRHRKRMRARYRRAASRLEPTRRSQARPMRGAAGPAGQRPGRLPGLRTGPRLEAFTADRTWNSYDLIAFLRASPRSKALRVAVLDNSGFHASKAVRSARKGLADAGIDLSFLPPHLPERNRSEPVFRQIKHQEIPSSIY